VGQALVLEDSKATRRFLVALLRALDFEVLEAADGREGLRVLERCQDVELMLVDWNMPDIDGLEFIRLVRKKPGFEHVPLMMVTTEIEMSRVGAALDAGADEYLMKPCTLEMVRDKLEILGIRGGRR
jgi:two-component system chemotaxis response regulator CheY